MRQPYCPTFDTVPKIYDSGFLFAAAAKKSAETRFTSPFASLFEHSYRSYSHNY